MNAFSPVTTASVLILLSASLPTSLFAQPDQPKPREQIGAVFGKPVYRDQIRTEKQGELRGELHRLFLSEVAKKYREDHKADIEPTEPELAAATKFFDEDHRERLRDKEPKLREQLKEVERELSERETTPEQRKKLEVEKRVIEAQLKPPGRQFALFILSNWKFQKHLYDQYGGGRILWQQAGQEAFDANRKWLESLEKQGDFKITDPKLRETFYEYWTTINHGPFLTDNKERIREEFLEPKWLDAEAK
jgi:hypothetical protein